MLKSRAERTAVGAAPDEKVVDVCVNFLTPSDLLLNHRSKKKNDPRTISAQEVCFDCSRIIIFILGTRAKWNSSGPEPATYSSSTRHIQKYEYE